MDNSLNCELTQIKDEPNVCKKEPVGRCDDLINEFVDYTMVSVPRSATEMSETDTAAFIDSITQSTSKQAEQSKPADTPPAECVQSMEVDENKDLTDLPIAMPIEESSESTSVPNTCDISTTPVTTVDPSASPPIIGEVSPDASTKDEVVMLLSDSDDEDKTKTDVQVGGGETETVIEITTNKEETSEVADAALDSEKVQTETAETADIVVAESGENDSNVIMLVDDSPENSVADVPSNNDSSKPTSTGDKGE